MKHICSLKGDDFLTLFEKDFVTGKKTNHRYRQRVVLRKTLSDIRLIKFDPRNPSELLAFQKRSLAMLEYAFRESKRIAALTT